MRIAPRPAAFFDRDGVLNVNTDYVHLPDEFVWIPGAQQAIRRLNAAGYWVFVVTNQSGVARGYYPESDVTDLHAWMNGQLAPLGAHLDELRYCPHHAEHGQGAYKRACDCRKPQPGMLLDLMRVWPVIRDGSFMIGDADTDAQAAAAAGVPFHYYREGSLDDLVATVLAAP